MFVLYGMYFNFSQDKNGNWFTGKVWPGITVYPDFFNPATAQYWSDQVWTMNAVIELLKN